MKNLLTQFIVSFLIVLIITLLIVWGLNGHFLGDIDKSNFESIGSIIEATFGIAVGLAGAFVAIKIASLANDVIHHERKRDDFSFINDKIEEGLNPIINVARQMALLYAAQISGEPEKSLVIKDITSDADWSTKMNSQLRRELQYKQSIATRVEKLADALDDLLLSSYSMFIWKWSSENSDEKNHLEGLSIGNAGILLNVADDLGEIIGLLRVSAKNLEAQSKSAINANVLQPRLMANNAKNGDNEEFDNISIRALLELGAEIWSVPQGGNVVNAGAAILLDIARCIPNTSDELKEAISELFKGIIEPKFLETSPILSIYEHLGPRCWFGASLNYALTQSENQGIKLFN